MKCVLTIAGSDSSGGAGIQADIKTISATGCYAASVITALTAQNTLGVQAVQNIPIKFLEQQLESVFTDLNIKSVKIGMLHNTKVIKVIIKILKKYKPSIVVLDPVMISKNNFSLLDNQAINFLHELFQQISLITPNLYEAEKILNIKINTQQDQEAAAIKMGKQFRINVLLKGGHLVGEQSSDVLYHYNKNKCYWFHSARIHSSNTHGTGCSLSAAIASYLAQDFLLVDAINNAKKYLTNAIKFGVTLNIGHGCGPVNHFYFLEPKNGV